MGRSYSSSTRFNYANAYLILLSIWKAYVFWSFIEGVFVGDDISYPFSSVYIKFCIFLPELRLSLKLLIADALLFFPNDYIMIFGFDN